MDIVRPFPTLQIVQWSADVLQPGFIEEIEVAVRKAGVDQGGGGVDQEPKIGNLTCPLNTKRFPLLMLGILDVLMCR